ncbi:Uncharacterised protein [Mycobacteroides abscessus subsp. abscessus]|nr:Uncharacterised protein [Mycobacteroides abscessus subsp. abscessus]
MAACRSARCSSVNLCAAHLFRRRSTAGLRKAAAEPAIPATAAPTPASAAPPNTAFGLFPMTHLPASTLGARMPGTYVSGLS